MIRGKFGGREHTVEVSDAVYAKRLNLTGAKVTLNGEPAKIGGIYRRFATVTQLKSGLSAEWSWEAVERIVAKGGDFKS
jgi:hypothetical protein